MKLNLCNGFNLWPPCDTDAGDQVSRQGRVHDRRKPEERSLQPTSPEHATYGHIFTAANHDCPVVLHGAV